VLAQYILEYTRGCGESQATDSGSSQDVQPVLDGVAFPRLRLLTPLALPAGMARRPPDPLQMMFAAELMHRPMALVCRAKRTLDDCLSIPKPCAPDLSHVYASFWGSKGRSSWPGGAGGAAAPCRRPRRATACCMANASRAKPPSPLAHWMIYLPCIANTSPIARSTSSSGPGPPSQARNSTLPAGPVIGERARPCGASPPSAAAASEARSTAT
jgi:hypothetical protein